MVPCESLSSPMNPLQGSGVSERSRCGAMRILAVADEPYRDRACRSALAVVPCPSLSLPMNPLQGSGVSERSRCGAVRILELAGEPSAGIGVSDRSPANPLRGSVWCRPCESLSSPMNPLRGSGVSERSRCGAVRILELAGEPSAGIGRVGSLAGEPSAGIGVVPCESLSSPMNLLRGSGVSERSRCGAVRILELAGEPLRGSDRSPANPLRGSVWCRANP